MSVHRECCNWCMWYGPINKDNTMRKHRPPFNDGTVGGRKVQDMSQPPCPGSNKPFATFGCDTVPDPRATEKAEEPTVTATACPTHHVADQRGGHTEALPVPRCASGTTYGVWDDLAGGFTFAVDCAMEAANWAAEQLDEDPDGEMAVKAVCRDHEEQPADACEDCLASDESEEEDEGDA